MRLLPALHRGKNHRVIAEVDAEILGELRDARDLVGIVARHRTLECQGVTARQNARDAGQTAVVRTGHGHDLFVDVPCESVERDLHQIGRELLPQLCDAVVDQRTVRKDGDKHPALFGVSIERGEVFAQQRIAPGHEEKECPEVRETVDELSNLVSGELTAPVAGWAVAMAAVEIAAIGKLDRGGHGRTIGRDPPLVVLAERVTRDPLQPRRDETCTREVHRGTSAPTVAQPVCSRSAANAATSAKVRAGSTSKALATAPAISRSERVPSRAFQTKVPTPFSVNRPISWARRRTGTRIVSP